MHEDVDDASIGGTNGIFHAMGNVVPFAHGHRATYLHVQVHIIIQPHFAHVALVEIGHALNCPRRLLNVCDNFPARRSVENFSQRRSKQTRTGGGDNGTGEKRGVDIGALPFCTAKQRDGDTEERSDRRNGIGAMVPGIGGNGSALKGPADAIDETEEYCFDDNDTDEDHQCEWGRCVMGQENFAGALQSESSARGENAESDDDGSERFGLAMAVGMSRIGRTRGEAQAAPNDDGPSDIERRFDAIGDEGVSVTKDAGGDFHDGENDIDG